MGEDATTRTGGAVAVVLDHEADLVAAVAIDVEVSPHRLGAAGHRGRADLPGVHDAVVEWRLGDVDAPVVG